jgi:hypothetical protein
MSQIPVPQVGLKTAVSTREIIKQNVAEGAGVLLDPIRMTEAVPVDTTPGRDTMHFRRTTQSTEKGITGPSGATMI